VEPTVTSRPQGPAEPITRVVLAAVSALFLRTSGRCGCSTQSGAHGPGRVHKDQRAPYFPKSPWETGLLGVPRSRRQEIHPGTVVRFLELLVQTFQESSGLRDPG
jgi:hypothetical protein